MVGTDIGRKDPAKILFKIGETQPKHIFLPKYILRLTLFRVSD